MKQVIVQSFCDLHEENEQVAATTEVTHNGRMLDVCEHHQRAVETLMRRLDDLFAVGVVVEVAAPPPSRRRLTSRPVGRPSNVLKESVAWRTCQEPGCVDSRTGEQYVSPTRSALGQHVKQRHSKKLGDYEWSTRA